MSLSANRESARSLKPNAIETPNRMRIRSPEQEVVGTAVHKFTMSEKVSPWIETGRRPHPRNAVPIKLVAIAIPTRPKMRCL